MHSSLWTSRIHSYSNGIVFDLELKWPLSGGQAGMQHVCAGQRDSSRLRWGGVRFTTLLRMVCNSKLKNCSFLDFFT